MTTDPRDTPYVVYQLPLTPGRTARLVLPEHLTREDAERLARIVTTIATQEEPT